MCTHVHNLENEDPQPRKKNQQSDWPSDLESIALRLSKH